MDLNSVAVRVKKYDYSEHRNADVVQWHIHYVIILPAEWKPIVYNICHFTYKTLKICLIKNIEFSDFILELPNPYMSSNTVIPICLL
jgi:hypothetical protein